MDLNLSLGDLYLDGKSEAFTLLLKTELRS